MNVSKLNIVTQRMEELNCLDKLQEFSKRKEISTWRISPGVGLDGIPGCRRAYKKNDI